MTKYWRSENMTSNSAHMTRFPLWVNLDSFGNVKSGLQKTMSLCRKNGPRISRQGKTNVTILSGFVGKLNGSCLSWDKWFRLKIVGFVNEFRSHSFLHRYNTYSPWEVPEEEERAMLFIIFVTVLFAVFIQSKNFASVVLGIMNSELLLLKTMF